MLPIVYRIWASARMVQLEGWFKSWVPDSVFSAGGGRGSVEAWYTSALGIEEVLSSATDSHVHLFVADVVKSFDTVDRRILDRVLSSLGLPGWFRHAYFEYHAHVRLRFKLAAGLGEPWTRDGAFSSPFGLGEHRVRKVRGNAADVHDAADVFLYRDSSIAPLLDMGRRFKAVMDVLDALIRYGIFLAPSVELTAQWDRILAVGPLYPVTVDDLSVIQGLGVGDFHRVVSGIHHRLSDFIHSVVVHRRDEPIRGWRNWLREEPSVHPYKWLRPDLVPPAPFLQCEPHLTPGGSGVLADPAGIDEEFRKAWLPYFCRSGQRDTSLESFSFEVEGWLPLLPEVHLFRLTGQMLADVVQRKSATAGSLDGWSWRDLKVLPVFLV